MGLINLKCTNCNAVLQGDDGKETMICPYCGSSFIVEKACINYNNSFHISNNIKTDNVNICYNNAAALIKRGYILLEYFDFKKAYKLFNQALEFEPENGDAYLGQLLARLKISKKEYLPEMNEKICTLPEYQQAYRFCGEDIKMLLEQCRDNIEKKGRKDKRPILCRCDDCEHNLTQNECTEYWKKPIKGEGYCPDFKRKKHTSNY